MTTTTHSLMKHLFLLVTLVSVTCTAYAEPEYGAYTSLLQTYVDTEGRVDYDALKENRSSLDQVVTRLEEVSEKELGSWSEPAQIAYWVNAYNAFTLQVILDHYPISSNWKASLLGHELGIRHISGVWEDFTWTAGGRSVTLDEIEHEILRVEYNRPGIHMALVCAAKSCPPLRREAYRGDQLTSQFADQTRQFLSNPKTFQLSANPPRVALSPIFKWFGEDFPRKYGSPETYSHVAEDTAGVFAFLAPYLNQKEREILASDALDVDYLDYDWGLNRQE